MSDEQEVKEKSLNKLIFVNCVDGFVGQNLAKYLSRCVVGASAEEMEEEEEEEEEHEDKEPVEPPADKVYHVIGSLKDKNKPKPGFVQDVVLFDKMEILYGYLITCDIIIYDISDNPDQAEEAVWVATQLAADMDKFDKSRPKTFILISSVLSWARTKPPDGEETDPDLPLTEDDFRRRKGHPTYKDQMNAEKAVLKLGKLSRAKLVMYVVTAGLTYGAEEGIFHYLFKVGWHNASDVPCLGDGRNILPTIHIRDLAAVIQNLADNRPKSRYILAVDDSNNTLREITKVVSKSLTTGKIRVIKEEEALLDRDRKQSDFDQLTVNLRMDPASIKEMHIRWTAEAGLVENIDRIIREYKESRQLVPIKVLLLGPPASGKSTVAQQLCQLYKLHHVRIKDVIDETIGKMQKAAGSRSDRKDEDAEEAEDEEEAEEEDDEDRDRPGDYESLLEAINESREQNNGKIEDSLVIPMFREKLRSKPCQNQGFILDGYPKTIDQAKELFASEDADGEAGGTGGRGAHDSLILPDLVVCFEATDDFLRRRVLNLPENAVIGTHYTEHGMAQCLGEYRALNAEGEETVVSFFEELEVPIEVIDVNKDSSVKMKDTVEKIKKLMGNPRNYGMTSEEEEETRSGETESRIKKETEEKAEREKLEAEESVNRKRRQDEWAKRLEEVKLEEQELLEAKATPMRNYLMKHVMPTLTRALIDCVKVRPEDAIDFVVRMLEYNRLKDM